MAAVMPGAAVVGDARSAAPVTGTAVRGIGCRRQDVVGAGREHGGPAGRPDGPSDIDSGRRAERVGDPADLLVVARVYFELVAGANAMPPPSAGV